MNFLKQSARPPINKLELKFNRPNESRFEVLDLLPNNKTGKTYMPNISFKRGTERRKDATFETISTDKETWVQTESRSI